MWGYTPDGITDVLIYLFIYYYRIRPIVRVVHVGANKEQTVSLGAQQPEAKPAISKWGLRASESGAVTNTQAQIQLNGRQNFSTELTADVMCSTGIILLTTA